LRSYSVWFIAQNAGHSTPIQQLSAQIVALHSALKIDLTQITIDEDTTRVVTVTIEEVAV
jgi:hypothetical protein